MQVEVLEQVSGGRVRVRSDYGTFTAQWYGPLPEAGTTHHVEIDVDDVVRAHDIVVRDGLAQELAGEGDRVRICGLVAEYGADDVLVVTVDGSPLMIDTEGDLPPGVVGRHVTLGASDVTLFPYEL
jgi:hypothetical protein